MRFGEGRGRVVGGLNGGRCQELIALGCSAGAVCVQQSRSFLRRKEDARWGGGVGGGDGTDETERVSAHGTSRGLDED